MKKFTDRQVNFVSLPIEDGYTLLYPEQTILKFGEGLSVDVGGLCFTEIEKGIRRRSKGIRVDQESFQQIRRDSVVRLVKYLSARVDRGEFRPLTNYTHGRRSVDFIRWCFENGLTNAMTSKADAEKGLILYSQQLRTNIATGTLSPNTVGPMLADARNFCVDYFGDIDFGGSIHHIEKGAKYAIPTEVPDDESIAKVLALCYSIFSGLTELVIERRTFPHPLSLPPYLSLPNNRLWFFPNRKPFMTADDRARSAAGEPKRKWRPIDFENGRLREIDDIAHLYPPLRSKVGKADKLDFATAKRSLDMARAKLDATNADFNHRDRIEAAIKALNAFIVLFAADTGMNEASIHNCPWNDDFMVSESRPNFRMIKFRAHTEVSFEVSTRFLPHFRRFLELRNYALAGQPCPTLFFTFGTNLGVDRKAKKMSYKPLYRIYDMLLRIDPSLNLILTRQWRINSVDFYIRNADIKTAALILQNSEETVKRHYAAGSQTTASHEWTSFFARMKVQVRNDAAAEEQIVGKLAGCIAPGEPAPADPHFTIVPKCRDLGGCVFCDKFVVHSDERDVRKLLSCKAVIQRCSHLAENSESFNNIFGEILNRIDAVVEAISDVSTETKNLIKRVKFEVEKDGILDPHFQAKLDQLAALGIVA